ncbi:MAG: DUF4340 domain-containing protein [Bacillota bacterium]|nr:DUF4340 domain-containing protein [Bacillota bacterium]
MKFYRNAIILVVILGILAGAYFVISGKKGSSTGSTANPDGSTQILKLDKTKIMEIDVKNNGTNLVFIKNKDTWTIKEPSGVTGDNSKIGEIESDIADLSATKLVEDNASNLAKYGLDNPVSITLQMTQGKPVVLDIGNDNDVTSSTYVKVEGSNKVYTISSIFGNRFRVKLDDVRSVSLFPFKSADVTSYTQYKGGNVVFKMKKDAQNNWTVTDPILTNADSPGIPEVLDSIIQTNIMGIVENSATDLSKYGLDKPSYTIELGNGSKTATMLFGKEDPQTSLIYIKMSDSNEVYSISSVGITYLDKTLKDVVDKFVVIPNINDLKKLEVTLNGVKLTADIATDPNDKKNDKFVVNGKDISKATDSHNQVLFRNLYEALISVQVADIVTDSSEKPSGTPVLSVTYHQKDRTDTVELIPRDSNYFYIMLNGKFTNEISYIKNLQNDGLSNSITDSFKAVQDAVAKAK